MKYIFYAKVLPEHANFFIQSPLSFETESYSLIIGGVCSKINIECENKDPSISLSTLRNIVANNVRWLVDVHGYTIACGYDVEIESVYDLKTKETVVFGVQEEIFDTEQDIVHIRKYIPPPSLGISSGDILSISSNDIALRLALSDFRESIRNPDMTAFHCMRAIESLKFSDFLGQRSDSQKLLHLREKIKLSKKTLDKISKPGKEMRHGKIIAQSWLDRKTQMLVTWETIRRYILLRLDNQLLSCMKEF